MQLSPHYPGTFITIEGIDGSGKSTFARALATALQASGKQTVLTKEPGGTTFGLAIRQLLQDQFNKLDPTAEFLLFAADRAHHYHELIIPGLKRGDWVITDRSGDSSLAYQGYGRGLDKERITSVNAWATQGVQPSITVYLRVTAETALARVHARPEAMTTFDQAKQEFLQHVIDGYETMYAGKKHVIIIDGTLSTAEQIKQFMSLKFAD